MKKLIILLLLFLPLSVLALEKKCYYSEKSTFNFGLTEEEANLEVTLECDDASVCYIVSATAHSSYFTYNTVTFYINGGMVAKKISDHESLGTVSSCWSEIGLDHPPSSGVPIMKLDNCNSVEYGCFKNYAPSEPEPEPVTPEASDKYKDIISCRQTDYNYISECGCMPAALTDLTSRLYMLIKIAAPALLLIIGGFDLVKAMSAQDESAINKARQKLIRKFIAAAAVFLIFTLVQFIVSTLANDSRTTMTCVDYLLNGYVA